MYLSFAALFLSFLTTRGVEASIGPVSDLYIVNKVVTPDGFPRAAVVAGSSPTKASVPGPLISARKGDRFRLNVIDTLNNATMLKSTSVHWHGMFQRTTNWADGAAFVSQCPISTGHSFKYEFSVPDQAGTYWYHSHLGLQTVDGLRGPLVIYDTSDPHRMLYDVDDESTVITLVDWFHSAAALLPVPPFIDSVLINGKGRSAEKMDAELTVLSVCPGKRYRYRVISMSSDPTFDFSIDEHKLTIIEVDGVSTKPHTVDSILLFPAQRYSFVLTANKRVDNYWVRAKPNVAKNVGFDHGFNSAILRYKGARAIEPLTRPPPTIIVPLVETNLKPLTNARAPGRPVLGGADVVINLNLGFDWPTLHYKVNNFTYTPPTLPVLLQVLSGKQTAQDILPAGTVYTLPRDKVIEVKINGGDAPAGPHPFHLHGHTFSVIKNGGVGPNFVDPVQRDVTAVTPGQDTIIRFVTDNPGPWMFHCHVDFHLGAGLAIIFAEDPQRTDDVVHPPPAWNQLCPIYQALKPGDR